MIILHYDEHKHGQYEGYNFCDVECENESHHNLNHQCEICFNNNSKIIFTDNKSIKSVSSCNQILCLLPFRKKIKLHNNLLSRPPPKLLT